MANPIVLDSALQEEYTRLFNTCHVNAEHQTAVDRLVDRVMANKSRYQSVSAITHVPWFIIAGIHNMEASMRFDRHLHNGDSLNAKTHNVPANRPPGNPPFTWEESAIDALQLDGMSGWKNWSLAGALFKLEGFNGFGYRRIGNPIPTPYLWSFSNHYTRGKFVADGKFDVNAVSKQCGVAVLFKALEQRGEISFTEEAEAEPIDIATSVPFPGHVVKQGELDSQVVSLIQQRLNQLGTTVPPLKVDGDFGSATEAAVRLFQARSEDHTGEPLVIDGEVGSLTWEALFGKQSLPRPTLRPSRTPLLDKVMNIARGEIGVMEDPPGSNRGEKVEAYLASTGLEGGFPWCAAFVHWCFEQAAHELGTDNPCIRTAGVLDHWNKAGRQGIRRVMHAQATGDPQLVQPGMIFIIDTGDPGGAGHTGLVERVEGGKLVTIEGNTNSAGGREGIGVFRRNSRKINSINKGFIDYSRG